MFTLLLIVIVFHASIYLLLLGGLDRDWKLILRYMFLIRYQLLLASLTFSLPLTIGRIMPENVLDLFELGRIGLAVLAVLVIGLAMTIVMTAVMTVGYAPLRFGLKPLLVLREGKLQRLRRAPSSIAIEGLALVIAAPALGAFWLSLVGRYSPAAGCLILGAVLLLYYAFLRIGSVQDTIECVFSDEVQQARCPDPEGSGFLAGFLAPQAPVEARQANPRDFQRIHALPIRELVKALTTQGWQAWQRLYEGHRSALVLLVSMLVFSVVVGGFLFSPMFTENGCLDRPNFCMPAVGYLLIYVLAIAWFAPFLAFFLDQFNLEAMVVIGTLLLLGLVVAPDHHFPATAIEEEGPGLTMDAALRAWQAQRPSGEDRPLIVVAASGGGIRASAWAACVMTQLEHSIGAPFTDSLFAVSSVSGGSSGSMYYLSTFDRSRAERRSADHLTEVSRAASAPSLATAVWGLLYLEPAHWLVGLLSPLLGESHALAGFDRGSTLDRLWQRRISDLQAHQDTASTELGRDTEVVSSLRSWGGMVAEGRLPIPLFNATDVERGGLVSLTPVLEDESFERIESLRNLHPKIDVSIPTAARLSSSFPYITPASRPAIAAPELMRLADGGYLDNSGILAARDILLHVAKSRRSGVEIDRVLLLTIRSSSSGSVSETLSRIPVGLRSLLGPLLTLETVRGSQQDFSIETARIRLDEELAAAGFEFDQVEFRINADLPLSWDLTDEQRSIIQNSWLDSDDELERVRHFLGSSEAEPEEAIRCAAP